MIVWLASYPKSGNTWVRIFLNFLISTDGNFNFNKNYIEQFPLRKHFFDFTENVNNQSEFAKNCKNVQIKINIDKKIKIFKTHNALWNWNNGENYFTDEDNTLGVIYIVRDPRNIITSIMNYFHLENYRKSLDFIKQNKVLGGDNDEHGLPTIIGSWSNHYNSWKKFKKNYLLIKYEDLLKNPTSEFFKIIDYLSTKCGFFYDNEKILKAIEFTKFNNLSKEEDKRGFIDNTKKNLETNKKFFSLGPENNWEKMLSKDIKEEIEIAFKNEMKELKYL